VRNILFGPTSHSIGRPYDDFSKKTPLQAFLVLTHYFLDFLNHCFVEQEARY